MNNKKRVFMAWFFALIALSSCSSFSTSTADEWAYPPYIPIDLMTPARENLDEAYEIIASQDYDRYTQASLAFRKAYEASNRSVALWRHLAGLTLWIRYTQGYSVNLQSVIASGETASQPHSVPLTQRYQQQNQRMINKAQEALK